MRPEIVEPTQNRAIEPSAPPRAMNRYFCNDSLPLQTTGLTWSWNGVGCQWTHSTDRLSRRWRRFRMESGRAAEILHLCFFPRSCWLLDGRRQGLNCGFVREQVARQEEAICNERWDHCAGNHGADQEGVLCLGDDLVIETEERRDRAESEAGGHHEGVVGARMADVAVGSHRWKYECGLARHFGEEQDEQRGRSGYQSRDGHK